MKTGISVPYGPDSFPVGFREGEREERGEEVEKYAPAVELMVLVHECFKRGLLTKEEKRVVKGVIFQDLRAFVFFFFSILFFCFFFILFILFISIFTSLTFLLSPPSSFSL